DRIIMHGFLPREQTADLLRESDAFVSASVLETFGVPFIEAMACGKPVIGVEDGPIDRYINKDNGILIKMDDQVSVMNAFKAIYINQKGYREEEISKTAINLFSEESVAKQIVKIYYHN